MALGAALAAALVPARPSRTPLGNFTKRFGIGKDTIATVWADHNLQPWKVSTVKISNAPNFEAKLVDVVGLYLNPPKRAVVFSFDEKTQCQAMDRTQPSPPMVPGRAGTMTHDYTRNGTTDLFAAMNVATGQALTHCQKGHTAKDVLRFFRQIDRRRWHLHFTPSSSSWTNLIERWFKDLTDRRLRRVFTSVSDLQDAIKPWAAHWNDDPNHSYGRPPPTTSSRRSVAAVPPSPTRPVRRRTTRSIDSWLSTAFLRMIFSAAFPRSQHQPAARPARLDLGRVPLRLPRDARHVDAVRRAAVARQPARSAAQQPRAADRVPSLQVCQPHTHLRKSLPQLALPDRRHLPPGLEHVVGEERPAPSDQVPRQGERLRRWQRLLRHRLDRVRRPGRHRSPGGVAPASHR
jgi:hypothetical protein